MVILNTCHIRDRAAEKVFSELGRLRRLKEARAAEGGRMILAVAGCVAQAEGAEILARAPYVDIVLGPQTYHRLPEMVARAARAAMATSSGRQAGSRHRDRFPGGGQVRPPAGGVGAAGADRVPDHPGGLRQVLQLLRGALHARRRKQPSGRGGAGARRGKLVAQGAREIVLLGQNVNAWHGAAPDGTDGGVWGLGRLLREMAEIPGVARLRYTTSHPRDMDDDADRGASRFADADAVPAPAGAVGIGSRSWRR